MNDKERLQLEEELLMTCSKAQAINKYIDELEESSKLSELWCKSQQENTRLKDKIEKIEEWLKYKAKALDTFDIPKRKETGAFWFTTRGEIDGLLELLKEN